MAANEHIQILAFHYHGSLLFHLLLGKVNQKVGHAENRVILLFADNHIHHAAILLCYYAMESQRQGDPLIFLDAPIIMGIKISHAAILIKRLLLQIKAAGINMRPQDCHALFHGHSADIEHGNSLLHADSIYLVPRLQAFTPLNNLLQITIALFPCLTDNLLSAFTLRLAAAEKILVVFIQAGKSLLLSLAVAVPDSLFLIFFLIIVLHGLYLFLCHQNYLNCFLTIISSCPGSAKNHPGTPPD